MNHEDDETRSPKLVIRDKRPIKAEIAEAVKQPYLANEKICEMREAIKNRFTKK